MHVLGHSFSQRRKSSSSKRPRDLHIRKVSFSGCSLSSGCSISSSSSSSTARTHLPPSSSGSGVVDPLSLNPTFQAPRRLYERPYIHEDRGHCDQGPTTFYDDEDDEAEDEAEYEIRDAREEAPIDMALPPHASPSDHTTGERQGSQDYFLMALAKRPPLPRSHWSESTIQTLDQMTPGASADEADEEDVDDFTVPRRPTGLQALSYKRNTLPKRPPMKGDDSVENFIKRGGWKRRGIVFNADEMNARGD